MANIIDIQNGNIFLSNAEALVNPVNCIGVMGAGLALQFKNKYPKNFEYYKNHLPFIGKCVVFTENNKTIINFPTKDHWKRPSKIEYIEKGMVDLSKIIKEHNIQSIAIPKIGSGLGGLDWKDVKPIIIKALENINISIEFYE